MKKRLKQTISQFFGVAAAVALLTACSTTDNTDPRPTGPYTDGVMVLNAGNFSENNGSLSWLMRTSNTASNNIFQARNNRPLVGSVQDYAEVGFRGLILVDNLAAGLDRIEIVTADSLRSVRTITGLENPRSVVRISDTKAYVSGYGATGAYPNPFFANPGYIAVIDVPTGAVTKRIEMPKGAEGITVVGAEAFVGTADNSGSKVIVVVDTQTDAIKQSITVPTEVNTLELDANNKLWGFSGKNAVRIDPATKTIEATIPVGMSSNPRTPSGLTPSADRRSFYYTYSFYDAADNYALKGELYRFGITDATIATTTPVARRVFSGLGFDPKSNILYAGSTPSYKQAGYVLRLQPTGQVIDSVRVEIAPSGFWFK